MALNYLKEQPLGSLSDKAGRSSRRKSRPKKMSKPKFFILLVSNLMLWLFVSGSYLNITPDSISRSLKEYTKPRGLVVTGVIYNSKMQAAIISDQIYYVGDAVKGFTITEINPDGVEFKKGEKKLFKEVTSNQ